MPDPGFNEDQQLVRLRTALSKLGKLHATINGEDAVDPAALRSDSTLGIKLGAIGTFEDAGGRRLYPIVVNLPGEGHSAHDALTSAVEKTGTGDLLSRIDEGWTEGGPSGVVRYLLALTAMDDGDFSRIIQSLPNRVATVDGEVIAELEYSGVTVVAPTSVEGGARRAHRGGRVGIPDNVTASHLHGIAAIIDELADGFDSMSTTVYDIREHDPRTNAVRDRWNRITPLEDVQRLITDLGWTLDSDASTSSAFVYHRGAETWWLDRSSRAFSHLLGSTSTQGVVRAFDLLIDHRSHPTATTPEELADRLVELGQISIEVQVLAARGDRPWIDKARMQSDALIGKYADAIRKARSRSDAELPLAFARTARGRFDAVVSVSPTGDQTRWVGAATSVRLLLAAAQPAVIKNDPETGDYVQEFRHTVENPIVEGVLSSLSTPGALAPLEHVAFEPVLTRDGRIVSQPGYDREARAFLMLPHRDRAKWAKHYQVPENPSKGDAQAAYEFLTTELQTDFLFATETDRARHFAYLLTCVARNLMSGSIGFAAVAQDAGTGKSLSLLAGRMLGQGHPGSTTFTVGGFADEETRKQLAAMLRDGGRHLHCDEVPRGATVRGKTLTETITAVDGEGAIRLLGGNDSVPLSGIIVSLAGNNFELGGDLGRRFMPFRFAYTQGGSVIARTEYRHRDLLKYIQTNRPVLLAAAHTIVLHGLQNEPSTPIQSLGFSHDWAPIVLGAMSHLDTPDGILSDLAMNGWFDSVSNGDETSEMWSEVAAHWWWQHGDKYKTAAELYRAINIKHPGQQRPSLPDALIIPGGESEAFQTRRTTKALQGVVGMLITGSDGNRYRIVKEPLIKGRTTRYSIKSFMPDGADRSWSKAHADAVRASEQQGAVA